MSTTVNAPATHATMEPVTGYDYALLRVRIREKLAEGLGSVPFRLSRLVGDLTGTLSDTIRVTNVTGIGPAESMTTMATENEAVTATGFTLDNDSFTVARHALKKEMSYLPQSLGAGRPESVSMDQLVEAIPASYMRKFMELICATGGTISDASGTSGQAWDVDKELALVAAMRTTEGFNGMAYTVRHPQVYEDLRSSLADESWHLPSSFEATQAIDPSLQLARPGGALNSWLGLENYSSFRVTDDGTDYASFAFTSGAIGHVIARTSMMRVENPDTAIADDDFGLLLEFGSTKEQAISDLVANAWLGVAKLAADVAVQRKIVSAVPS